METLFRAVMSKDSVKKRQFLSRKDIDARRFHAKTNVKLRREEISDAGTCRMAFSCNLPFAL
jgi:hypothetical protein